MTTAWFDIKNVGPLEHRVSFCTFHREGSERIVHAPDCLACRLGIPADDTHVFDFGYTRN
tara:strand:+ start:3312 stop:3491 length:180 start_codon:yes stop_codon:yes gene_type:complete